MHIFFLHVLSKNFVYERDELILIHFNGYILHPLKLTAIFIYHKVRHYKLNICHVIK
jgi:hypothetical protein